MIQFERDRDETHPWVYWEDTQIGDVPECEAVPPRGDGWIFAERVVIGRLTVFRWKRLLQERGAA